MTRRRVRPDARVSVVVIARDAEAHLLACLRSVARQSHAALDVVIVDDGSLDGSAAAAERVAAQDARFRVLRRPRAGRSAARNAGAAAADGELLLFLDGDDLLPPDAVRRLLDGLDAADADVAAGGVHHLDGRGARPAVVQRDGRLRPSLARRRGAAVLPAGTGVGHLLLRRDAWDGLHLAFDPRLAVHEDLPVAMAALTRAGTVATVGAPVLVHRRHPEDRARRRLEHAVLGDLLGAVDLVLAGTPSERLRRAVLARLLGDELAACLRRFDLATPGWRGSFQRGVAPLLDALPARELAARPALERIGWALLAAGRPEELVAVLGAERVHGAPPPRRVRGRRHAGWVGELAPRVVVGAMADDSSFHAAWRTAPPVTLPAHATRLRADDPAVRASVALEAPLAHDGAVVLTGRAALHGAVGRPIRGARGPHRPGAAAPDVALRLVPRDDPARSPLAVRARAAEGRFDAALPVGALRGGRGWSAGTWDLWAEVRGGGVRRWVDRFALPAGSHGTRFLEAPDGVQLRATSRQDGRVSLGVETHWVRARRQRTVLGGMLVLSGDLRLLHEDAALELRRRSDGHRRHQPLAVDRARLPHAFEATIPLHDLAEAPAPLGAAPGAGGAQHVWELWVLDGAHERRVGLPPDVPVAAWFAGDRVVSLLPTPKGHAVLVEQDRTRVPAGASLGPAGRLAYAADRKSRTASW